MADTSDQPDQDRRLSLSRATSNTFKALFALAAVIAAGATYVAVTDTSPQAAGQPGLFWLLIANLVAIAGIGGVLGLRVLQLLRENRQTGGGARLRLRIIFLFSLAAAIPTVLVAGFLAVTINRSVENWFSAPIQAIVESARAAGDANVKELTGAAAQDLQAVAADLGTCNAACQSDPETFEKFVRTLAEYRNFPQLTILDPNGHPLISLPPGEPALPSDSQWSSLKNNARALSIDANAVRGVARLPDLATESFRSSGPYLRRLVRGCWKRASNWTRSAPPTPDGTVSLLF